MKSSAAALLLRHHLTLAPGHRVEQKISLTLFMKDRLKVNVHPRDLGAIAATLAPVPAATPTLAPAARGPAPATTGIVNGSGACMIYHNVEVVAGVA
ncbi:hypothetical protein AAC387_Pa11g0200 [Persea americana]